VCSGVDSGQLVRIDPSSRTVVARIQVGGQPTSIAFDASGAVWVGNLDGSVQRVDPASRTVQRRVRLPGRGGGIALELDPQTGAFLGAVHTGGQPRESLVAAGVLWIVDQAVGALTPLPFG
jgi:DNA-binding beta-propeller fold protein YncE